MNIINEMYTTSNLVGEASNIPHNDEDKIRCVLNRANNEDEAVEALEFLKENFEFTCREKEAEKVDKLIKKVAKRKQMSAQDWSKKEQVHITRFRKNDLYGVVIVNAPKTTPSKIKTSKIDPIEMSRRLFLF